MDGAAGEGEKFHPPSSNYGATSGPNSTIKDDMSFGDWVRMRAIGAEERLLACFYGTATGILSAY